MKIAKTVRLGVVAASLLTLNLPTTASADPGDAIYGGCSYKGYANQVLTQGQNEGVIEVTAVMTTSANTPDSGGWVHCKIQVNEADSPGTQIDAAPNAVGIVQSQAQISYDDQDGILPSALCEKDDWSDSDTTGWVCHDISPSGVVPASCSTEIGQEVCASVTKTQGSYAVSPPNGVSGPDAGSIATYQFTLPNGGKVTVPCAVLVSGATTVDPCAAAGGTYVATLATLSDAPNPVTAVQICNANLVLTVDGIGINSFPALVLC